MYKRQTESSTNQGERAQSEVFSMVLVIAITVIGTTFIIAIGASALEDAQQSARTESAENAMTQLDSTASLVALGGAQSQRVDLGHAETNVRVEEDTGWLRVAIVNATGSQTVLNTSLGAVVYENDGTTIAYQGGGSWRHERDRSVMISAPEFRYRENTLTLPLIKVERGTGSRTLTTIKANGSTVYFPNETPPHTNPLQGSTVEITIKSNYYEGWAEYVRSRTAGDVIELDNANETVTAELTIPSKEVAFDAGITAVGSGQMKIETGGAVDTYSSDVGPYAVSKGGPGDIRTATDIKIENSIEGNVFTRGSVDVEGTLTGNACAEGSIFGHSNVNGWTNESTCKVTLSEYPLPDGEIATKVSTYADPTSNDNDQTSCISGNEIVSDCTGSDALTAGTYYLATGDIEDRTVHFDTSGGDVDVVVDDDVLKLAGSSSFDIVNPNPTSGVTFYVDADLKVEGDVTVETDANQSADLMTLKIHSNRGVKLETGGGSVSIVGIIYAPGSGCGSEEMKLETGAEIFGALVVDCPDKVETVGTVHYDKSLGGSSSNSGVNVTNSISYLHISVNRVTIGSDDTT